MFFEKLYSNQSFIVSTLDYYKEAKRGLIREIFEGIQILEMLDRCHWLLYDYLNILKNVRKL